MGFPVALAAILGGLASGMASQPGGPTAAPQGGAMTSRLPLSPSPLFSQQFGQQGMSPQVLAILRALQGQGLTGA